MRPGEFGSHLTMGPVSGGRFVEHAHPICEGTGCQMAKSHEVASIAMAAIREMGVGSMSQALWCDHGGHAFSERDPGRRRISMAVLDEDTGQEKTEMRDFCGACAEASGMASPRKTRPAIGN